MAIRRQIFLVAIGLEMDFPEGVGWELIVDEDALVDGEGEAAS